MHPRRSRRRRLRYLTGALAALLLGACRATPTAPPDEAGATVPPNAQLTLSVTPVNGEAPLAVRLTATLAGNVGELPEGGCPTLAWTLGNGDVMLAQADGCRPGVLPRSYSLAYTYRGAGSFDASVRLLALDVPGSNHVSVLVRGPTATPAPRVAQAGPTIVIATAAATRVPATARSSETRPPATRTSAATAVPATATMEPATAPPATAPAATAAATTVALAAPDTPVPPTAGPAQPASPPIPPTGIAAGGATVSPTAAQPPARFVAPTRVPAAARVLPADLYYLTRDTAALMRLGAAGGPPELVLPGPVADYAVAASGLVAYVAGDSGQLALLAPGAQPVSIAASPAAAPVWTLDGRRLAYAQGGVFVYDLATAQTRRLVADDATPLAWSRDGRWLAVRRASDKGLTLVSNAGARQDLPIAPVSVAGWLPDRDVLWAGGKGLLLLTVTDTVQQTRLLTESVAVLAATATADQRLLALGDAGTGAREYTTDLAAAVLTALPSGPPLPPLAPPADLAWAPGGQTLAVGHPTAALDLLATGSGAAVVLVPEGGRRPAWVLGSR